MSATADQSSQGPEVPPKRYSRKVLYYGTRYAAFRVISRLVLGTAFLLDVAVALSIRPHYPDPAGFFIIGFIVLMFVAFLVGSFIYGVPFFRAKAEDRRRLKAGLPVDSDEPGPWQSA